MITPWSTVRAEIATALGTIDDLTEVYGVIPAAPVFPCAVVLWPDIVDFDDTAGGTAQIRVPVTIYVPSADTDHAQTLLDTFLESVKDAVESHDTVVWSGIVATTATGFRAEKVGSETVLAFDTNLLIIA
jgi:hypothetical protein